MIVTIPLMYPRCYPFDAIVDLFAGIAYLPASDDVCCATESRMKIFNPEKLVGSLQLRTNEQQDARSVYF